VQRKSEHTFVYSSFLGGKGDAWGGGGMCWVWDNVE
jgi:hypothetical protein